MDGMAAADTGARVEDDVVPARAPGVVLHGPMAGSGYEQPPCLVRRGDGQAIQLTALVYAVLAAVDGRRDWDGVAGEVSASVERPVSAADVQYLAEHRLRPAGLLLLADGGEPTTARSQPLLGLKFRVAITRPDLTRLIAAPFAPLFSPLASIPVLLAFVATTWWVLAVRGVGGAVDEALAEPVMVLALVAATILSAAFHEIGHAAACRYSGARPGAMGAGLYLVWPVFYTDVTDSYRLGRAGRLRVDLGGLYFNAVFSVGAVGLWWATQVDALLLIVPIQLVQMLRQLIPLVRFDGYHILADLIGVPDLFARVRPTVLRLIGRPDPTARPLRPWATAVVGAWVLVVVPALLVLFGLMAWHLPAVLASSADSLTTQWQAMVGNLRSGQEVRAALGVVAILTIGLVPVGIVVVLSRLAARMTRGFMAVTEERGLVRVAAVAVAAMLAVSMGPAWLPEPPVAPRMVAGQVAVPETVAVQADEVDVVAPVTPEAARPVPAPARAALRGSSTSASAVFPSGATVAMAGDQPTLVVAQVDDWPFPFAPPADARPGDNVVVAVNTIDGGALFEMTSHLAWITEGTVANPRNVAMAASSCESCTTTAVAFQVVLAIGRIDTAIPVNEAVAVNHECGTCATEAVAVQLMVTLEDEPTPEVLAQIEQLWAQVEQLEQQLEGQPAAVIHHELGRVRDEIVQVVAAGGTAVVGEDDGDAGTADFVELDPDLAVDQPYQRPGADQRLAGTSPTDTADQAMPYVRAQDAVEVAVPDVETVTDDVTTDDVTTEDVTTEATEDVATEDAVEDAADVTDADAAPAPAIPTDEQPDVELLPPPEPATVVTRLEPTTASRRPRRRRAVPS